MNLTAVQLRESRPSGRLLFGSPSETIAGARGPIALFEPGAVFAYVLEASYRRSLFVVRAPLASDPSLAMVPGVRPGVRVLLELHARTGIRKARQVLNRLRAGGHDPEGLSEATWSRMAACLAGRRPAGAVFTCVRSNLPCGGGAASW